MEEDRREHGRLGVVCRIDYTDAKGRVWFGLIKNVSLEGTFVEYTPGLQVGEMVLTTFALPGSPPFKLRARVVRLTPKGAGLRFVSPSAIRRDRYPDNLETYCAALYKTWLDPYLLS